MACLSVVVTSAVIIEPVSFEISVLLIVTEFSIVVKSIVTEMSVATRRRPIPITGIVSVLSLATALRTVREIAVPLSVIEILPPPLVKVATLHLWHQMWLSAFLGDFFGSRSFWLWSELNNNLRFVNFMIVKFGDCLVSEFGVFITDDRLILN